ncbi:MAG: pyruvate kinase alpha/beta domain-containing protein [Desulfobacterales bacterium]|nr:pyruvate kinase alpha/beta domain-containing protein [Desulfobacterales bacterium]
MQKSIVYFRQPGEQNTPQVIQKAKERALELGIKEVVVASTSGKTGVAMADALKGTGIRTVAVTHHYGSHEKGKWDVDPGHEAELKALGAAIVSQTHSFSGIEKAISRTSGGISRIEIVADTLRKLFGRGFKVAVEVAVMAADSGAISMQDDIIALGGSARGADVACVIRPAHSKDFFSLQVKEIIAMPQEK